MRITISNSEELKNSLKIQKSLCEISLLNFGTSLTSDRNTGGARVQSGQLARHHQEIHLGKIQGILNQGGEGFHFILYQYCGTGTV